MANTPAQRFSHHWAICFSRASTLIALVDDCLAESSARGEDGITSECAHAVLHPGSGPAPDFETQDAGEAIDGVLDGLEEAPGLRRAV